MADPRETSGATTSLIASYVRERAGAEGLARVHAAAGIEAPVEALMDERRWFTYEEKIALFEAAAEELHDPDVTRHVGENALMLRVGAGVRVLLRTLGSPRVVVSNIARANQKFSTVSKFEMVELGRTYAVISYELSADKEPHRLDCLFNQGLVSVIGPLFGYPLLQVQHRECQVLGAPRCVYRVQWPRKRVMRRRGRTRHLVEQVDALSAQVGALQTTAADLVSSDDIAEVLTRIVARAGVAVSAPRYLLAVRDERGRVFARSDGFVSDADALAAAEELLAGKDMGDRVLVQPITSARRDYGVLAAFYEADSFFDYERDMFEAYARSAAAALDAVHALEEARRRNSENEALLELATSLAELATPDAVAQRVAEAMQPVLDADVAVVILLEDDRLVIRGLAGASGSWASELAGRDVTSRGGAEVLEWLASPEPRVVHHDTESEIGRWIAAALGVDSLFVVPIQRRGKVLGATGAGFVGMPPDAAELMHRSLAVADHAAIALDNAHLLARVTHQAFHDDITDVDSPAHFEEETERALARADRNGTDLSLLFLDLDHFKAINDRHGHLVGDQVLREVATRIRRLLRAGDLVGRLGGDEFAITLCDTSREDAMVAAERLRLAIEEPIAAYPDVHVSASIGITTAAKGAGTYGELLRRSDTAMYEAKHAGRNNWAVADAVESV